MNEAQLFQIAKIIDNEYIGKEKTFTANRIDFTYWYLTTNFCDSASLIRVYEKNNKVSTIHVNGEYTDGWQDIHPKTWAKVSQYLSSLNSTNGK